MARYGKDSRLNPDRVLGEAAKFFGPGGLGLEPGEAGEGCAYYEGGGGHVLISACAKERGSEVELETREWDYQVQEFLKRI